MTWLSEEATWPFAVQGGVGYMLLNCVMLLPTAGFMHAYSICIPTMHTSIHVASWLLWMQLRTIGLLIVAVRVFFYEEICGHALRC
jgi:hypothetical protein